MVGLVLVGLAAMWIKDKGWVQRAGSWVWEKLAIAVGTLVGGGVMDHKGFTPGPWFADEEYGIVRDGKGQTIADLTIYGSPQDEANTRIIADAPNLVARIAELEAERDAWERTAGIAVERRAIKEGYKPTLPGWVAFLRSFLKEDHAQALQKLEKERGGKVSGE